MEHRPGCASFACVVLHSTMAVTTAASLLPNPLPALVWQRRQSFYQDIAGSVVSGLEATRRHVFWIIFFRKDMFALIGQPYPTYFLLAQLPYRTYVYKSSNSRTGYHGLCRPSPSSFCSVSSSRTCLTNVIRWTWRGRARTLP